MSAVDSAGWIKAYRRMLETACLQEHDVHGVFTKLLLMAQHRPRRVWVDKLGRSIQLERGQCWVTIRGLATKHCNRSRIARILKVLKSETVIETASETGVTIVTICKYDEYQLGRHESETLSETPSETVARQWRDTEQEGKESKEKIQETPNGVSLLPADGQPQQQELIPENFPKKLPRTRNRAYIYPAEFDRFWAVYPQRGSDTKIKAYNVWRVPASNSVGVATLLAGATRYRSYIEATNGEPAHVKTWINREGWTGSYRLPLLGDQRRMSSASILADAVAAEEEENLDEHRTDDPRHEDWGCDSRAGDALVARDIEDT